jgi:hypothetical protein
LKNIKGRDLVLDRTVNNRQSYFRIQLDDEGYVSSLTYYGDPDIPSDNYISLSGLHELYLNRLISRYDEGIIDDFVRYSVEDLLLLVIVLK